MKLFNLNNKEYSMIDNWSDLTLYTYIEIMKLESDKEVYTIGELFLIRLIEILCGAEPNELDDLTMGEFNELSSNIKFLDKEPVWSNVKYITINNVNYVFPNDLNKLTMGEYISVKTLQENCKLQSEIIPSVLSIILRPGKLVKNEETGEEYWIQNKFDAENLEYRKELFMGQPIVDLMGPVGFFLTSNVQSIITSLDYTKVMDQVIQNKI